MKAIFFLMMFSVFYSGNAQDKNLQSAIYNEPKEVDLGFIKTEGTEVYYQRVFNEDENNYGALIQKILASGGNQTMKTNESVSFTLKEYSINYKKFGGRTMNMPIYLRYPFSFVVRIEKKESRYRITISNIEITDNTSIDWGGVETGPTVTDLEEYVLKRNGQIKNSQKEALRYINLDFSDLLTVSSDKYSDDW